MRLRVGTRRSPLAVVQTEQVCAQLRARNTDLDCELVRVETTGDRIQDRSLRDAGGKALFVKELDELLLAGAIDCAVHSLKDVPSVLPAGITIAAVPVRADVRDVLLSARGWSLAEIPDGAVVGTTSLRRAGQVLRARPGVVVRTLRGNVATRLRRIVEGDFDATFLAAAGLRRLRIDAAPLIEVLLEPPSFVPAPGQGALCVTAKSDADSILNALRVLDDASTRRAVEAERAVAEALGGSCYVPLGAYACVDGPDLELRAIVVSPDGTRALERTARAPAARAEDLGRDVARQLLADGADDVIAAAEAGGVAS